MRGAPRRASKSSGSSVVGARPPPGDAHGQRVAARARGRDAHDAAVRVPRVVVHEPGLDRVQARRQAPHGPGRHVDLLVAPVELDVPGGGGRRAPDPRGRGAREPRGGRRVRRRRGRPRERRRVAVVALPQRRGVVLGPAPRQRVGQPLLDPLRGRLRGRRGRRVAAPRGLVPATALGLGQAQLERGRVRERGVRDGLAVQQPGELPPQDLVRRVGLQGPLEVRPGVVEVGLGRRCGDAR